MSFKLVPSVKHPNNSRFDKSFFSSAFGPYFNQNGGYPASSGFDQSPEKLSEAATVSSVSSLDTVLSVTTLPPCSVVDFCSFFSLPHPTSPASMTAITATNIFFFIIGILPFAYIIVSYNRILSQGGCHMFFIRQTAGRI